MASMHRTSICRYFKQIGRQCYSNAVRIAVILSVVTLVLFTIAATSKGSVVGLLSERNNNTTLENTGPHTVLKTISRAKYRGETKNHFAGKWQKSSTRNNNKYSDDHREAVDHETIKAARAFDDTPYKNAFEPADLMPEGPFSFLPNYKNPCFTDPMGRSNITCLPYVFLIGFPKCGTTDMFFRLTCHPEIAQPRCKEPHWLTRGRFNYSEPAKTLRSYLYHYFGKATIEIHNSADGEGYHNKITGDFSASTSFDNERWRLVPGNGDGSEPRYTNADYVHRINPNMKIMVMVRDPIDRCYSDFLFFNKNVTAEKFHIEVTNFIAEWTACLKIRTLRNCLYSRHDGHIYGKVRPRIGMYSEHIAEFLRVFPRDQLLFIKMEEYSADPATAMQNVFHFLNITRISTDEMGKIGNADIHANRNLQHSDNRPMVNETRRVLAALYKPYNDKLADLLGDETFNYNPPS